MTTGFAAPFPPVVHSDDPDNDPTLIYAFHFWLAPNLQGPLHQSTSRYGPDFYIWDLLDGAMRLTPDLVNSEPSSRGYNTAVDTATLVPNTGNDFYYQNRGFDIRGVMGGLADSDASCAIIFRYGRIFDDSTQPRFEDNETWKYARDPVNTPVPPYGTGDLRVFLTLETACEKLGPLLNDRAFTGYGSRLLASNGHARTVYRFYTKRRHEARP